MNMDSPPLSCSGSGSVSSIPRIAQHLQNSVDLPPGKTSIFWAIFLVVNAALGAGLLAFPLSFYMTGGVVIGVVTELILIIFVVIGVVVLVFVAGETGSTSYESTVEAACGPIVKVLAELCLVAFCFGSNTAYLVVIEDQLEDVFSAATYRNKELSAYWWGDRRLLVTVLSLAFILPWLFVRRIGILSYTSFFSVLCCFYIACVVVARYFSPFDPHHTGHCGTSSDVPQNCSRNIMDSFIALPFICFGYQCHVSAVPVYTDMKSRNLRSFVLVIIPAVLICFTVYSLTGVFGYLTFHNHQGVCIASDILVNYCPKDIVVDAARIFLVIVIITSYPILTFCGRTALDSVLIKAWSALQGLSRKIRVKKEEDFLSYSPTHYSSTLVLKKPETSYERTRLLVISGVWFVISLLLAVFVPDISDIISLTGGLAASFIFIFPGLVLISFVLKPEAKIKYTGYFIAMGVAVGFIIVVFGSFIFGISVAYTIMHDAKLLN